MSYLGDEEAGESLVLVEREEPLLRGAEDQAAVTPPTVRIRMRDSACVNNNNNNNNSSANLIALAKHHHPSINGT
jgi:hypothetical protein